MSAPHQRVLLVEGLKDRRVIAEVVEGGGVPWPSAAPPVHIEPLDGYRMLIAPGTVSTELKAPGLTALGVLVDADLSAPGRWQAVRDAIRRVVPDLPEDLPEVGLVHAATTGARVGLRVGVWVMPDNRAQGYLETFLAQLLPDGDAAWPWIRTDVLPEAKRRGATFKDVHADKAAIHSWLAWRDEPGAQLHEAVKWNILTRGSPRAAPFVTWFRTLFQV